MTEEEYHRESKVLEFEIMRLVKIHCLRTAGARAKRLAQLYADYHGMSHAEAWVEIADTLIFLGLRMIPPMAKVEAKIILDNNEVIERCFEAQNLTAARYKMELFITTLTRKGRKVYASNIIRETISEHRVDYMI